MKEKDWVNILLIFWFCMYCFIATILIVTFSFSIEWCILIIGFSCFLFGVIMYVANTHYITKDMETIIRGYRKN